MRAPRTVPLLAALVLIGAAATSATSAAGGAAPPKAPPVHVKSGGIVVLTANSDTIARFPSLKCKTTKHGLVASGKEAGGGPWTFLIQIYKFSGFHSYDIDYGNDGNADFNTGHNHTLYSNIFKPNTGGPVNLTKGGSVAFPHGRGKLRIAFGIAYQSGDFHRHVSVFGTASCSYPRKRGKR